MLAIAEPFRSRKGLVVAGLAAAALLIVLAGLFLARAPRDAVPAARKPDLTRLDRLPARPEDIEAHGDQARSLFGPDEARRRNAEVPFALGLPDPARPFVFSGTAEDRAKALGCLATAVLYEAGDDLRGQQAVAQVVLNRVRHAAFPATVCGVVYQGSQRATGCQFTFTCDGSLRRAMTESGWRRARAVAERALSGEVDRTVGLATHYHTDWVYPYWSPELSKLARVGTHLFFGWPGSWGGPRAFARAYRGGEPSTGAPMAPPPVDPGLALGLEKAELAMPRLQGVALPPARLPAGLGKVSLQGNRLKLVSPDERAFGLLAGADATAARLASAAAALCARPGPCEVSAWANEDDIPGEFPIPAGARGTLVFEWVRGDGAGKGNARFDCKAFPGEKRCL